MSWDDVYWAAETDAGKAVKLIDELNQAKAEVKRLQAEIGPIRSANEDLDAIVKDGRVYVKELKSEVERLQADHAHELGLLRESMVDEAAEFDRQVERLRAELDRLTNSSVAGFTELQRAKAKIRRLQAVANAALDVERVWWSLPDDFDPPQELAEAVMAMGAGYALHGNPAPETEALAHADEIEFYRVRMNGLQAEVERLQAIADAAQEAVAEWRRNGTTGRIALRMHDLAEALAAPDVSPTTEVTS